MHKHAQTTDNYDLFFRSQKNARTAVRQSSRQAVSPSLNIAWEASRNMPRRAWKRLESSLETHGNLINLMTIPEHN